jgi:arylsulfatase A-like enzyme
VLRPLPAAILIAALAVIAASGVDPAHAEQRPDVIVIVLDDAHVDMIDAMPRVQEMVVQPGVLFRDAMVPTPLCCPSRASILTGRYAHTTGVYGNGGEHGGFPAFDDRSTLATWLDRAGYRTGLFGKYLNRYLHGYVPPGWDRWVGSGQVGYENFRYTTTDGTIRHSEKGEYSTYLFAERAARFIRRTPPRKPLFVYFAPFAVHRPLIPAPEDVGSGAGIPLYRPPAFNEEDVSDKPRYVRNRSLVDPESLDETYRLRYELLASADRSSGWLLDALVETGRMENAIVIVTSDNGMMLGEHRLVGKNVPYDRSVRVFMAMRYQDWSGGPEGIVANVDIAPTLERVTGVDFPRMDGESLLPLVRRGESVRRSLVLESLAADQIELPSYCGVRTLRHLYVRYRNGFEELYDYSLDPYELTNVASDPSVRSKLDRLRSRTKRLCDPTPPGYSW